MKNIPIVWVDVGRRVPRYLKNNIELHRNMFPNRPQILLTDKKYRTKSGIDLFQIDVTTLENYFATDFLRENISRDTSQWEFWINTTKRFMILEEFMSQYHVNQIIHQESDDVILDDSLVEQEFNEGNWGMAYPLQADGIGCASILLVNNLQTLSRFNRFVQASWDKNNRDDMQLLGEFSIQSDVKILPSGLDSQLVYDPQAYGRFFFGTDARNMRWPFAKRGLVDTRDGAINISSNNLELRLFPATKNLLVVKEKEEIGRPLVNVHLHSKRIPKSWKRLSVLIKSDLRNSRSKSWYRGSFDRLVAVERVLSWLSRRVLRRKFDLRLR